MLLRIGGDHPLLGKLHAGILFGGERRSERRSTGLQVQSSRHGMDGIPNGFAFESATREHGEQSIVRINLASASQFFGVRRKPTALIGLARQDELMEPLQTPTVLNELGREEVL